MMMMILASAITPNAQLSLGHLHRYFIATAASGTSSLSESAIKLRLKPSASAASTVLSFVALLPADA